MLCGLRGVGQYFKTASEVVNDAKVVCHLFALLRAVSEFSECEVGNGNPTGVLIEDMQHFWWAAFDNVDDDVRIK